MSNREPLNLRYRWVWFVAFWLAGVAAVGLIAWLLRWLIRW
ncbi:DUF2474 domain-containing protein [Orrella sp. NBD-18]|uniref:DUF2474 domain-containing protein n=1 Tax=Sheuella amnicola TaxID=2707330 RepID=A0A6B2R0C7_9BURK|nr:DUF2474 domain-containing protein [Sheuella amnicola]NDY82859.1 DUF2474 domain-containing protein [Sheuella amnicola]HBI83132.1 DUF2474 domain-containing protein [Alcaligenaceae bacterium]